MHFFFNIRFVRSTYEPNPLGDEEGPRERHFVLGHLSILLSETAYIFLAAQPLLVMPFRLSGWKPASQPDTKKVGD